MKVVTKEFYVASDGAEFESESAAIAHEAQVAQEMLVDEFIEDHLGEAGSAYKTKIKNAVLQWESYKAIAAAGSVEEVEEAA